MMRSCGGREPRIRLLRIPRGYVERLNSVGMPVLYFVDGAGVLRGRGSAGSAQHYAPATPGRCLREEVTARVGRLYGPVGCSPRQPVVACLDHQVGGQGVELGDQPVDRAEVFGCA